jgi:hypothetical protein
MELYDCAVGNYGIIADTENEGHWYPGGLIVAVI